MLQCEGIAEVEDGDDETDKLSQSHDQRHHEGGALRDQNEDSSETDVSEQQ